MAKGTFDAVGTGPAVVINERANLSLVFGGGTVKLQRFMNDDWRDVPNSAWTGSTEDIIYSGSMHTRYRLNCTAYTAEIKWEIS